MISASFYRGERGRLCFEVHGHAEGEGGRICAAASGICYTVLGYLENMRRGEYDLVRLEPGRLELEGGDGCEEALKLTCIGLIQLAVSYPDSVSVENGLWDWTVGSPVG